MKRQDKRYVSTTLQASESDTLFTAEALDGTEVFVYVLMEHQITLDPRMPGMLTR